MRPHRSSDRLRARMRYRWRLAGYRLSRYRLSFDKVLRIAASVLSVATLVASLLCIVDLLLYFGFDHNPSDLGLLRRGLRVVQGVFALSVVSDLLSRHPGLPRGARCMRAIVNVAVLLTLWPLVLPSGIVPGLDGVLRSRIYLLAALTAYSVLTLSTATLRLVSRRTNPSLLLSASFLFFILVGSLVLMLPKCTHVPISYVDSLFVSTSAVCITGLTTVDVASTFTPQGLLVLALLIQVGGIGVITFTSFFAIFFSGTQSIFSQMMLRDMVYSRSFNSLLPTLLYVLVFTLCVEAIGAVVIYATVPPDLGLGFNDRVVFSAFLSLSAFCNAGFTNIPDGLANPALLAGSQSIYLAVSAIVIAGAIGFPILVNFKDAIILKLKSLFRRRRAPEVHIYDLNTKLVITATTIIFLVGAGAFFVLERDNTLRGMPLWQQCVQSVFNAVTPRSAGFASVSPAAFLPATLLVVMLQMWIGGASQSMAGGIKVNTVAVVFLSLRAVVHGHRGATAGHRTIAPAGVRRAHAVVGLSIVAYAAYAFVLLLLEPRLPVRALLFETLSALFTVGSSLGITDALGQPAKVVLCTAMFVGRVGILSLLMGLVRTRRDSSALFPSENVIIN